MKRVLPLAAAASCLLVGSAWATTYQITIENDIPGGMDTGTPFTPPVAVVHDASYSLFAPGTMASPGVEALARDGVTADLASEIMGASGVSDYFVGSGPFFDLATFELEGDPGDLFSVVMMLGRSNDLITGVHDIALPATGSMMLEAINVYDAGVEVNTGMVEDIPFYGNTFVGPDEDAVISMISTYAIQNDPDHGKLRFDFPPSATITITVMGGTPTLESTWGEIKSLYQ